MRMDGGDLDFEGFDVYNPQSQQQQQNPPGIGLS